MAGGEVYETASEERISCCERISTGRDKANTFNMKVLLVGEREASGKHWTGWRSRSTLRLGKPVQFSQCFRYYCSFQGISFVYLKSFN